MLLDAALGLCVDAVDGAVIDDIQNALGAGHADDLARKSAR